MENVNLIDISISSCQSIKANYYKGEYKFYNIDLKSYWTVINIMSPRKC